MFSVIRTVSGLGIEDTVGRDMPYLVEVSAYLRILNIDTLGVVYMKNMEYGPGKSSIKRRYIQL